MRPPLPFFSSSSSWSFSELVSAQCVMALLNLLLCVFTLLACWSGCILSQRNHEAESMCQPFLTSNVSSPLIPGIKRNLKIDEDGEYFCELVLQDRELPPQVRVTIHEGLAFLAIRHVQMGLERHNDVYRHLKILAEMVPTNFNFQYRAGMWSLDPMIAKSKEGVGFLREALYGVASVDADADENAKVEARKFFAEGLGMIGEYEEAQKELLLILKAYPLDFGVSFLLKDITYQLQQMQVDIPSGTLENIEQALSLSQNFYELIAKQVNVKYQGFRIPDSEWAPHGYFNALPSDNDFEGFIDRREPFAVTTDEMTTLNTLLNWEVDKWQSTDYLRHAVGPDVNVLVECLSSRAKKTSKLGFGGGIYKSKMSFESFMEKEFSKDVKDDDDVHVLHLQDGFFREGIWNNPLNKLKSDIPVPPFLAARKDNISSVSMWMSNACDDLPITTRLRMDPMDSFVVVVSGQKNYTLFSPDNAPSLQTISPTFGVSPSGFAFQYNSPANFPSFDDSQIQGHEIGSGRYHFSALHNSDLNNGNIVKLTAGDAIFIPAGWYYESTSVGGPTIAVNFKWLPTNWRSTWNLEKEMKAEIVRHLQEEALRTEL